jgi:general stress protein 26
MKAMLKPRKRTGLREFYFSTNTSSMRVKQFRNNPKASIYFYHKGLFKYVGVMLVGTMEVLTDQASDKRKREQIRCILLMQKGF